MTKESETHALDLDEERIETALHIIDMVVARKLKVHPDFYEVVDGNFEEILPFLLETAEYSPVDLLGEPLWTELTSVGQRQAIFCLRHMATLPGARLLELPSPGGVSSFQIVAQPTR
jgi:hypothetical protein